MGEIGWVTLAMFGARSAAMSLNRLIDKAIDLRNPRTEKEHFRLACLNQQKSCYLSLFPSFCCL